MPPTRPTPSSVCRSRTASGRPGRSSGGPGRRAAEMMVSVAAISALHLHDEVQERIARLHELVRDPARYGDHIALGQPLLLAAFDAVAADLAAGDDRGGALYHPHHVHLALVQLGGARAAAAPGVDLVVRRVEQEAARLELLLQLRLR